jgi:hypothetical protein
VRRGPGRAALAAFAVVLAGCAGDATPRAEVSQAQGPTGTPSASATPEPTATPSATPPAAPTTSPATSPAPSLAPLPRDLRDVRLPAGVCHADVGPVQLKDGYGRARSKLAEKTYGSDDFYVHLPRLDDVRADLDGDGTEDAAELVSCEGYGGGNAWTVHVVVLTPGPNGLRLLGDLQPDDHGTAVGDADVTVVNGRLHTVDRTYRPDDPHCCPKGYAWTEWRWDGTRFVQSGAGLGKS